MSIPTQSQTNLPYFKLASEQGARKAFLNPHAMFKAMGNFNSSVHKMNEAVGREQESEKAYNELLSSMWNSLCKTPEVDWALGKGGSRFVASSGTSPVFRMADASRAGAEWADVSKVQGLMTSGDSQYGQVREHIPPVQSQHIG
jgi:hypothetical protein